MKKRLWESIGYIITGSALEIIAVLLTSNYGKAIYYLIIFCIGVGLTGWGSGKLANYFRLKKGAKDISVGGMLSILIVSIIAGFLFRFII